MIGSARLQEQIIDRIRSGFSSLLIMPIPPRWSYKTGCKMLFWLIFLPREFLQSALFRTRSDVLLNLLLDHLAFFLLLR